MNFKSLKEMDMAQLKGMGNSALGSMKKEIDMARLKGMGNSAMNSLKEMDMTRVKGMGSAALTNLKQFSKRKVAVGGYSMSPLVIGGAAVAVLVGIYLLSNRKRRAKHQYAGDTAMQPQYQPVK
ncbi:MAG: hypothetical protein K0Q66_678 [Chitinophagaceae bacterium]|jgi:hypothetical protein|nr:hypothetical protein [Chitinophagaceae bacterium]